MGALQQALIALAAAGAPAGPSTWNPLDKDAIVTLSNGNLRATTVGGDGAVRGTLGHSTGKWYAEVTTTVTQFHLAGVAKLSATLSHYPGFDANGWSAFDFDGHKYNNGVDAACVASFVGGTLGILWDATAGEISFQTTSGLILAFTGVSGTLYLMWGPGSNSSQTRVADLNVGGSSFVHSLPSGASAWG